MNNNFNTKEVDLVELALCHLEEHSSIKGTWKGHKEGKSIDGTIELGIGENVVKLLAEVKQEVSMLQLNHIIELAAKHEPFILIARTIYKPLKEELRRRGIGYLDAAGNIFLSQKNHFVFIEGNLLPEHEKITVKNRAFNKTGLRVIYALLTRPDALSLTYRELAKLTGVSLGAIPLIFEGLKNSGYLLALAKNKFILTDKKKLVERWINGYRETLKPSLLLGSYRFVKPNEDWHMLSLAEKDVWGGEAGAELLDEFLTAEKLTIYTNQPSKYYSLQWRLIPDPNGSLQFYQKFWDAQDESTTEPLLIYADLIITDDPRCLEAAESIYEKYIQAKMEE